MAELTRSEIRNCVIGVMHDSTGLLNDTKIARCVQNGEDIPFDSLEIDSLCQFEIIMGIEEKLNLELDADEVFGMGSVDALTQWLADRIKRDAG